MNEVLLTKSSQVSAAPVPADVMRKRVFSVAKLLATAQHPRDSEAEGAENSVKKHRGDKLRYRVDGRAKQTE
jgi:hypothetical protein